MLDDEKTEKMLIAISILMLVFQSALSLTITSTHEVRFVHEKFDSRYEDSRSLEFAEYQYYLKRLTTALASSYGVVVKGLHLHSLRPGSVIANFSLVFESVSTHEVILLQNAIEDMGIISTMPVVPQSIASRDVPSPPLTVYAFVLDSTTINVTWSPVEDYINENLTVVGYFVFYKRVGDPDAAWMRVGKSKDYVWSFVSELEPYTTYTFRVVAFSSQGMGLGSPYVDERTLEGIPKSAPTNLQCDPKSPTQISLRWIPINATDWNGFQQAYVATYRVYSSTPGPLQNYSFDPYRADGTLPGLAPYTTYEVYVAAATRAGSGPVGWALCSTMEGVPSEPPTDVTWELDPDRPLEILVTWRPIPSEFVNGLLAGYVVCYGVSRIGRAQVQFVEEICKSLPPYASQAVLTENVRNNMEITIYVAGRTSVGTGVRSKPIYAETCKCPSALYAAWFPNKPYIWEEQRGLMKGIFPEYLHDMVLEICKTCYGLKRGSSPTQTTLYWNRTRDGRSPRRLKEKDLKEKLASNVDMHVAVFGRAEIETFQSEFKFVLIVESPGSVFIIRDYLKDLDRTGMILTSLANCWPAVVVIFVMSMLAGIVVWALDCRENSAHFPHENFVLGSLYHGTYWAFVSMTTVGYGDKAPRSFMAQLIAIVWMLLGPIINCIVIGTITTSLTTIQLKEDPIIYGARVAAMYDTFEYTLGLRRNALMNTTGRNYTSAEMILDAVGNNEEEGALLDSLVAIGVTDVIESKGLKVSQQIAEPSGWGIVLSGEMLRLVEEVRSYVASKKEEMAVKIKELKGGITVTSSSSASINTGIIDGSSAMFRNFAIGGSSAFLIALCVGGAFDFIRRKFRLAKVKPENEEAQDLLHTDLKPFVEEFCVKFQKTVRVMSGNHETQLKQFFWRRGYSFGFDGWLKKKTWDEEKLKQKIRFDEIMEQDLNSDAARQILTNWHTGKKILVAALHKNTGQSQA